ncbi:MAG TPA: hypothetical protein VGH27_21610 [Streptosporangiaceae bacterium]|jgi:hypothetical protein
MSDPTADFKSIPILLAGEVLTKIDRTLDMSTFSFGPDTPWLNAFGVKETRARFAIHAQCPFAIWRGKDIILEDGDMRCELTSVAVDKLRLTGWDWERDEPPTVFDAKAYSLHRILEAKCLTVQDVAVTQEGDLSVSLSEDILIQILPPKPAKREAWRFFEVHGNQIVFPGKVDKGDTISNLQ